jgi:hypothetical protein
VFKVAGTTCVCQALSADGSVDLTPPRPHQPWNGSSQRTPTARLSGRLGSAGEIQNSRRRSLTSAAATGMTGAAHFRSLERSRTKSSWCRRRRRRTSFGRLDLVRDVPYSARNGFRRAPESFDSLFSRCAQACVLVGVPLLPPPPTS